MNLSNKLTLSRIVVIPFFIVALTPTSFNLPASSEPFLRVVALVLFVAAAITDYYDGALARRHGWITDFGKLMDPLADKVLVMAAFVCLVELGEFPAWLVVIVLAREFLITGLRMLAGARGRILAADRLGKHKTVSQLTTIITALVFIAARDWLIFFGLWDNPILRQYDVGLILSGILHALMIWCVVMTVLSGWRYCMANRDVFMDV